MEQKVIDLLEKRGITADNYSRTLDEIPAPPEGVDKLLEVYYILKNTADMEYPYWYNRTWEENDGDVTVVRRAKAEAAALSHLTPTIQPYEKLVMQKTKNVRGAFPFPWVTASFLTLLQKP